MAEPGEALARVRAAAGALSLAERALADSVQRAHAQGHSWAAVGAVLGTSRQAAFKRFGRPRNPRTGETMAPVDTSDVLGITEHVFTAIDAGRYADVRALMPDDVARVLTSEVVLDLWARVVADTGNLVRCEGSALQTPGGGALSEGAWLGTVVGVTTLVCEAGEWEGRVAVGQDRRVLGLLVVEPGAPDLPF